MSLEALLIHSVRPRRMVADDDADRYGNKALSVEDPDADTLRARVQPSASSEELEDRDEQRLDFLVFLDPSGADLEGVDELDWLDEDVILRIAGPPRQAFNGIGLHHLELDAYRVTG